jgi:hypothetical protein
MFIVEGNLILKTVFVLKPYIALLFTCVVLVRSAPTTFHILDVDDFTLYLDKTMARVM